MRWHKYGTWLTIGLTLLTIVEIIVLGLRIGGIDVRIRVGPFIVSIHSIYKPLWIALATSVVLLIITHGSRPWRVCAFVLSATAVVLALVAVGRVAPSVVTKSDIAVTELYVQLAGKGRLLDGPYSRFGWHHPGPLYFWLQVPFYELSGRRGTGLYAGALALNFAALAVLAWVLLRTGDGLLTLAILVAWLLFAWRDRFVVSSPWTGHIPVIPMMTFVVLAAAVASGRRWMLLWLVFFGSLMTQSHVALIPVVAALTTVALVTLIARARGREALPGPAIHLSLWLFALLWLLPIAEQLAHEPGNLARLWNFFVASDHAGKSVTTAFLAWSYALVGVLRPDVYTPYGGHFELTHLGWGITVAVAELLALAFIGLRATGDGLPFQRALARMALLANVVALWSITHIQGDIVDHEIYWIAPLGAMNLAIIAAAAVRTFGPGARRRFGPHGEIALATTVLLACVYVGFRDFDRLIAFESNRPKDRVITTTHATVQQYLSSNQIQKPLFRIGDAWDVAAAVLLRLHASEVPFAVEDSAIVMFTETFSAHGDEDAIITIGRPSGQQTAGGREVGVVQEEPVYVDARRVQR
jgi:hypothetical protein